MSKDNPSDSKLLFTSQRDLYAGAEDHLAHLEQASASEDLQVAAGVRAPRNRNSPLAIALTLAVLALIAAVITYRILAH